MKVVYKKTIREKIIEAKQEAQDQRKQIDYIELTSSEYEELLRTCGVYQTATPFNYIQTAYGIEIRCRQ